MKYVFGDSITSITERENVRFEQCPPRRFDVVVAADGPHFNVRRLILGAQGAFSTFIGAYLAVLCVPAYLHLDGDRSCAATLGAWPESIVRST